MLKAPFVIVATSLWLLGSIASPADASSKSKKRAAAVAAAIAAVAIAANAKKHRHDRHRNRYRYRDDYRRYDSGPRVWSPAPAVTCYANTRSCYVAGRGYSPRWTRHEFF